MNYSSMNRTIMLLHPSIFQKNTLFIDDDGEFITPYFDQKELSHDIVDYFNDNVEKYCDSLILNIKFLEGENNASCISDYCRGVSVSVKAKINYFYNYENGFTFYISEV